VFLKKKSSITPGFPQSLLHIEEQPTLRSFFSSWGVLPFLAANNTSVDLSISVNSSHTLQRNERGGNMGMYAFHVIGRTYAHFADLHM
jgi:hypothetical protein